MVKPEDITDSAMMLAEAVNDEIFRIAHDEVHVLGHTERKAAIARAIMAAEKRSEEREREACAALADCNCSNPGCDRQEIADAIRNRGAEQ